VVTKDHKTIETHGIDKKFLFWLIGTNDFCLHLAPQWWWMQIHVLPKPIDTFIYKSSSSLHTWFVTTNVTLYCKYLEN
jgi:hypothetical protein